MQHMSVNELCLVDSNNNLDSCIICKIEIALARIFIANKEICPYPWIYNSEMLVRTRYENPSA